LDGKPLIYHTIKAIQDSNVFDRFILSTESQEIADVAESYGVEVPFLRPIELAQDDSMAADAIAHALTWIEQNDKRYDYVQYIFPTAPLRTAEDIRNGVEMLFEKDADMVMSVCETSHPPFWANELPEDHSLRCFIKRKYQKNRQELPVTYRINGSIYVGKWDIFYEKKDYYAQNTYAYIMPEERSVDIDTEYDFNLAEFLLGIEQ
jgi:N-acylneuraminate cytidylyltransferase/CMP-N,N'-diacetyllegionaminic acid synthase